MAFSATVQTWLDRPVRETVLVAKLTAYDSAISGTRTLWVSTRGRTTLGTETPANEHIRGILEPVLLSQGGQHPWSRSEAGGGGAWSIRIINPDGEVDAWADYDFRGYTQEIYIGDASWTIDDFEVLASGEADGASVTEEELRIIIPDPFSRLTTLIQPDRIDGAVNAAADGRPIPLILGRAHYVPVVLIDDLGPFLYQFHDTAAEAALDKVFANGFELAVVTGTTSTWDSARTNSNMTLSSGDTVATQTNTTTSTYAEAHGDLAIDFDNDTDPVYFEVRIDAVSAAELNIGIGDDDENTTGAVGDNTEAILYVLPNAGIFRFAPVSKLSVDLPTAVAGDVIGVLVDPPSRIVSFYLNGDFIAEEAVEAAAAGALWYPFVSMEGTAGTKGSVALLTDIDDLVYIPPALLSNEVLGQYGDYTNAPADQIQLIRNPNRARITAHAASVTPATWESWSIPTGWILSNSNKTVAAWTSGRSGVIPAPRATGRFAIELECDSKNTATPAVELCATWPHDPDSATSGQGYREGLSWYDNANVRGGETGAVIATASAWGSGDVLGIVVDKEAETVELYENGTLRTTIEGYKISARWGEGRGAFSGSNYYSTTSAADSSTYGTDTQACGCFLLRVDGTPTTNDRRIVNWGSFTGVQISLTTERKVQLEAFDTGGTTRGKVETSELATGKWHAILWAMDTDNDELVVYVNDVDDTNILTAVTTSAAIEFDGSTRSVGASAVGGRELDDGAIAHLAYAPGQYFDLTDETNRRLFFDADHQPMSTAWADVFSSQPSLWAPDGDVSSNGGTAGNYTENGTVPEADPSTFRTAVFCPGVYTSGSNPDTFTLAMTGLAYDYGGARPWGEAMSAAEMLHAVCDGVDDFEHNFAQSTTMPALLGHFNARETTVASLVREIAMSVGAMPYFTPTGLLRLLVITDPDDETSAGTIDETVLAPLSRPIARTPDRGEMFTRTIAAWRVWHRHSAGEVSGAAVELGDADVLQSDFGILSNCGETPATYYDHATKAPRRETLISDGDPRDRTGPRSSMRLSKLAADLYSTRRCFYRFDCVGLPALEVGQVYTLQVDRFGLDAGKKVWILGVSGADEIDQSRTVIAWG